MDHVTLWFKLPFIYNLDMFICVPPGAPRSLQHLCRLVIRSHMSLRTLNDPESMAAVAFPPRLKSYLTYREYDQFSDIYS